MSAYREMKIDKSLYQRRGGFFRGDRLGRALCGGRCGRTAARQQQGSESQGCELELFHAFLTSFYS